MDVAAIVSGLLSQYGHGTLTRSDFDQLVTEAALPARLYADLLTAATAAGVLVGDGPRTTALANKDESESDDEADDDGWDADGFGHFLHKTHHQILAMEEEQELGRLISEGRLAQQLLDSYSTLDPDTRLHMCRRVERAKTAADDLARHNIRLVVSIAGRMSRRATAALSLEDLVQEGYLGLAHAISKWDYTRGLKFSTYATWWIRQYIDRAIKDKAQTIRLPVHVVEQLHRMQRAEAKLRQAAEPTTVEAVAKELGVPAREVERLRKLPKASVSLDLPLAGTRFTLADTLADPFTASPEDVVDATLLQEAIDAVLSDLTEREQEIIRCRFGLDGSPPQTLEQLGRSFGVTRERIRQVEAKTVQKLKHPQRSAKLAEYIDRLPRATSADADERTRKGR